jgi:hypothetical protein
MGERDYVSGIIDLDQFAACLFLSAGRVTQTHKRDTGEGILGGLTNRSSLIAPVDVRAGTYPASLRIQ